MGFLAWGINDGSGNVGVIACISFFCLVSDTMPLVVLTHIVMDLVSVYTVEIKPSRLDSHN